MELPMQVKKWSRYLAIPAAIVAYLLFLWFREPFLLLEHLDYIMFYSNTRFELVPSSLPPLDRIVFILNQNSAYYDEEDPEGRPRWKYTGFEFFRRGTILVIYHHRMNNYAAKNIIQRFISDEEFIRWKLLPRVRLEAERQAGRGTPSWGDRLKDIRRAGFSAIVLSNGSDAWELKL